MADNNPMDMLSKVLSNPDAISKMSALFQNKPAKEEQNGPLPDVEMPYFTGGREDDSTRLLHALEPFLSSRRRGRIPQMLQVMQIGKMLGGLQKK